MKGIIFSEQMFRATIEGRKTQTRRICKPKPTWLKNDGKPCYTYNHTDGGLVQKDCKPRYKVGEKMYLKEPYCLDCDFIQHEYSKEWVANGKVRYKYKGDELSELSRLAKGFNVWSNPLFMTEKYARYFIEITAVRCDRVQDISDDDCYSEGIYKVKSLSTRKCYQFDDSNYAEFYTPQQAYAALFDKINGDGKWDSNPYVWVYSYKLVN